MISEILFESPNHKFIYFGKDFERPDYIIDTNQYLLIHDKVATIMDPGGIEMFSSVSSAFAGEVRMSEVKYIFSSHQDPDVISALSLWLAITDSKVIIDRIWSTFISHYGAKPENMIMVEDTGMKLNMTKDYAFEIIPAHYLHSPGHLNLYDPVSKILFTGDIGAALVPKEDLKGKRKPIIFVQDFDSHIKYMEYFHKRWMPSNEPKKVWIDRISKLDIEMIAPQHGLIFKGKEMVSRFLTWFDSLKVGLYSK
ncbi:MAG: FprA family A-type flavoprotein [Deltaproteobacteria bacterium]|nr:FprA family A-type flavoprotein [Deltaproteobacteria bacterium]MCL5892417.1 FprA family A-type flavoprotein [Deltaproteobacteria bacterium]